MTVDDRLYVGMWSAYVCCATEGMWLAYVGMAMNVVNRMISVAVSDDIVRRGGGDIYNMLFFLWTVCGDTYVM